jgi:hypothetical protein
VPFKCRGSVRELMTKFQAVEVPFTLDEHGVRLVKDPAL